ncbi:addiction module protein [Fulvivirga sediminis]|uniref:Addiction module protein n=1 Tax=Fulvivirga sediminis TaxID=2803949 RepID=A0A937F5Q2_9BACT|nr:addiction module protein [Fulvivirga sediminis]MBL3656912.1 addiction module protein [Fulvivirga sediminis]
MKITLDIQDSKYDTFLKFIKTLNYVSINQEDETPQWQKDEVNRRMQLVDKGDMKTRNLKDTKEDLFKK